MKFSTPAEYTDMEEGMKRASEAIDSAEAILIGASNGLSISEGYNIFADNEMFRQQFGDLRARCGIRSVLDGVFAKHMSAEDYHEYMSRLVRLWTEEYKPTEVMLNLHDIVSDKPHFILTSNCDEHLEKSGFSHETVWEIEGTFRDFLNDTLPADKQPLFNSFLGKWSGKRLVILELGIGSRNRLIKLPLMQLTFKEPQATYITLNLAHEIYVPEEIASKSIALSGDIASTLRSLKKWKHTKE